MLSTNGPGRGPEPPRSDANAEARPSSGAMLRGEGRVTMARRGSAVATSRLSGVIEPAHVQWLVDELERELGVGVTILFVDASRATVVSPDAARTLVAWLTRQRPFRAVCLLAGSTGLGGALEALGPVLRRFDDPESFQRVLAEHQA